MKKKWWIILIIAIVILGLGIGGYFWYQTRGYHKSCDVSWANKCLRYMGSKQQMELQEAECLNNLTQWYECQGFKNLEDVYGSEWYKEKYQECYYSYYGLDCGVPEEMCTINRLVSGKFCD